MHGHKLNPYIVAAMMALGAWMTVGHFVFALRHPWATETQRFLHTADALLFRSVEPPKPPETPKPIITVCSGCGTEWESMGPGQPEPITKCPNCPITPEELDALIGMRR
jgi:hypothetical protein